MQGRSGGPVRWALLLGRSGSEGMTTLDGLQRWYAAQCDGEWEHQQGVQISTLDNPGWRVIIDLKGTNLAGATFTEISDLGPEADWFRCWVEGQQFHGACGPHLLDAILGHFLRWTESVSSGRDA